LRRVPERRLGLRWNGAQIPAFELIDRTRLWQINRGTHRSEFIVDLAKTTSSGTIMPADIQRERPSIGAPRIM
jgi:hypothetical protein